MCQLDRVSTHNEAECDERKFAGDIQLQFFQLARTKYQFPDNER